MEIVKYCKCIICCRVSPKQKQEVVSTVREMEKTSITLAIGDGANDVNMITAAHVGIGIQGVEGQQAARASDYSLNQFKDLRRLLFYHGRECYRRNSGVVCYNFYKNVLLVLPQFWFGWTNWFSGQTLYNSFIYQLFNIFFASVPIMIFAVWDEEYPDDILVKNEKKNYYEQGIKNKLFNSHEFWMWVAIATVQSGLIVVCSLFPLEMNFVTSEGQSQWFWATGTMVFGLVVVISNMKILIMSTDHSLGSLMILAGSMLAYLITWVIVSSMNSTEIYRTLGQMFQTPNFHIGNILCIVTTSFFDWAFSLYRKWTYDFDEKQHNIKVDLKQIKVKANSTFPIKMRTFNAEVPKKQFGFVKDETKATYATSDMKKMYYQDTNTGYAFNQIDKNKYNEKQKEQQMF